MQLICLTKIGKKKADRRYEIFYSLSKRQGCSKTAFTSLFFYLSGKTALWNLRILAVGIFLGCMKLTGASLSPGRDDVR